ncbi:MAG: lipopolysaccharide assembly protein LapA domain-containing protein [Rhodomicrobiaceae bacterium]
MRSLRYLVLFLIAIVAIAFAVANRHLVRFVLDPVAGPHSTLSFEAPLFIFLFLALLIGFLIGAFATWFSQARWRHAAKRRAHELFEVKKDNERLTRHLRVLERAPQIRAFATNTDVQERPLIH